MVSESGARRPRVDHQSPIPFRYTHSWMRIERVQRARAQFERSPRTPSSVRLPVEPPYLHSARLHMERDWGSHLWYQGGLRVGVPTSNNEFKHLSVFLWTYKRILQVLWCLWCSMFDAANFMGRWIFTSDKISITFHLLFDQTKLVHRL